MNASRAIVLLLVALVLGSSSCVSKRKLTYLQYSDKGDNVKNYSTDNQVSVTPAAYKIMPFDNLYIRVVTPDPQWSALFNASPIGQGGAMTEESAGMVGYPVDVEGNIEIPFIGEVSVIDRTLTEIKTILDSVLLDYVTDASITVRLVNNYISIIGEVKGPGRYALSKDRVNIFEALSLAGDMNEFSNRQKVQLIRPSHYGPIIKEFSLLDRSILSSELYYVMPNDIIYVMPMQGKANTTTIGFYTLFLSTITSALVIISYFRTL